MTREIIAESDRIRAQRVKLVQNVDLTSLHMRNEKTRICIENETGNDVFLGWIDFCGNKREMRLIGRKHIENTSPGHLFVLRSHSFEAVYRPLAGGDHNLTFHSKDARMTCTASHKTVQMVQIDRSYHRKSIVGVRFFIEKGCTNPSRILQAITADVKSIKQRVGRLYPILCQFVSIYIDNLSDGIQTGAAYHPRSGQDWLRKHLMDERKAGCIYVYAVDDYMRSRKCWGEGGLLLHEMVHCLHDHWLENGFDNKKVVQAYQKAKASRVYGSSECQVYAMTDFKEYLAEISVAFFGRENEQFNKSYPCNNTELLQLDPIGYNLCKDIWINPHLT